MFISWANSQVGISTGTVGASAPRIGRVDKSDIFRLRMLLEHSQDRVIQLAVLLREADHRIKNSLQIATSVMQAEARRADSVDVRDALKRAASRIQAISTVHDTLQTTSGESMVDVGQLMEMMCDSMQDLCDGKAELICHEGDASLAVPVTFARTLTILVNELIVNALRHAFARDRLGKISVSLKQLGDDIQVMVQDDGVGVETTPSSHTGFGTDLINMMVRQIGGKLVSQGTSGSCFTLTDPLPIGPNPGKAGTPPMTFA
tara:strand:- start:15250 stop:16032 length:783 start_codon:yes stop_codon:yes gene_type:complete